MMLAFSLLMVCQASKYPLGMYMTGARGLRFQAWAIVAMVPLNLGLSWVLAIWIGAPGPVFGSFIGVLVFQVLANSYYVRRDLRRRVAAGPTVPEQDNGTDEAADAVLAENGLAEVGTAQDEISGKGSGRCRSRAAAEELGPCCSPSPFPLVAASTGGRNATPPARSPAVGPTGWTH